MATYKKQLSTERIQLLQNINEMTERPLVYLSFVWFGLVILEMTAGISRSLELVSIVIWVIFIADFLLELTIAPSNKKYLRDNWLNGLSLLLPALRVFRVFQALKALRAAQSLRSLNLLKIVTSLNRSVIGLRQYAVNYGLKHILIFTVLILVAGAAGIQFFENSQALAEHGIHDVQGINSYSQALWWSVMLVTTIGSDYWPQTLEGRILTIVLSLYAIAIFGYITATLASILIDKNKR